MVVMSSILNSSERHTALTFSPVTWDKTAHNWSYVSRAALLTRNLINAAARSTTIVCVLGRDFPEKVKLLTTEMRLLSLVGVPFSLGDLKSVCQKVFASAKVKDWEGVGMGGLSFSIVIADIFDSVTTFVNAALTKASMMPIGIFSSLGLPTAFAISGLGTVSRTIQIAKSLNLYQGIEKEPTKAVMEKAHPERFASKKAVDKLHKLRGLIAAPCRSERQTKKIDSGLKKVQSYLVEKMYTDAASILANGSVLCALSLFLIGSTTALPFLFLALAFAIRIAVLIYQDHSTP